MKTAIVLCATVPHILLLEKLKQRGYRTVVVDMNPKAPAVSCADEFVCESAFDKEAVIRAAKEYGAELVVASCAEQANSVCCYVAEKLGLPHPYSYETSLDVTDKGRMKTLFKKGGVTTADFMIYQDPEDLRQCTLEFPLVVKPVDAYSSKGVRKAENKEELLRFGEAALKFSRAGRGIAESYCPGKEIQVDCVAIQGRATVLMTRSKSVLSQDAIELNSSGSVSPAEMTAEENDQAAVLAQRICDAFGLQNTPFFYQARLNEGIISVLEFAPRIGGGLSFKMIKQATGVDVVELSIDSFLGNELSLKDRYAKNKYVATVIRYMEPGVFGKTAGLDELLEDGTIEFGVSMKKRGDTVSADRSSSNRAVTVLMAADTREELENKKEKVLKTIDILDIEGKSRIAK